MRVEIDADICGGFGTCVGKAPTVFELTDAGYAVVLLPDVPEELGPRCRRQSCSAPRTRSRSRHLMSDGFERFRVDVDDAVLDDLRDRLARTRFPDPIPGTGWEYGTPIDEVRDLVEYWRDEYDWRAAEAQLNELDQFVTEIDGQRIHFVHERSPQADALPLVLVHGWPGSIVEFLDVIPRLTADGFHVIVPSLPGYGFSEAPRVPGWDIARVARAFVDLMERLGYDRYGAQGGDWGAQITTRMAIVDSEHCVGLHLNMPIAGPPRATPRSPTRSRPTSRSWRASNARTRRTRNCRARSRRRSASHSRTPRRDCWRGSRSGSAIGATATVCSNAASRAISSSRT